MGDLSDTFSHNGNGADDNTLSNRNFRGFN